MLYAQCRPSWVLCNHRAKEEVHSSLAPPRLNVERTTQTSHNHGEVRSFKVSGADIRFGQTLVEESSADFNSSERNCANAIAARSKSCRPTRSDIWGKQLVAAIQVSSLVAWDADVDVALTAPTAASWTQRITFLF